MEGNKNDQEVRGSFVGEPWGTDPSSLGRGRKALIKHRPIVPAIQELRQEDHKLKDPPGLWNTVKGKLGSSETLSTLPKRRQLRL